MTFHKDKDEVCPHMKELLSACADGSLKGIPLWYTRFHTATCVPCAKALAELQENITQLRTAKSK
jgi:hypothetical protein